MAKDGLTKRPWYRMNPGVFLTDVAVLSMTRQHRLEYREALDLSWLSETPGLAPPDQWRKWLGYGVKAWGDCEAGVCMCFVGAFKVQPDGQWLQKHLYEEYLHATSKSQNAKRAADERHANAQRTLADALPTHGRVESREVRLEKKQKPTSTPLARSDKGAIAPSRLSLPCTSGQWWTPDAVTLAAWKDAFPGVPAEPALQRMKAWLLANPTRGKTLRGMSRFATAWLAREQDSGKQAASSTPTGEAAIAAFLAESDGSDATR